MVSLPKHPAKTGLTSTVATKQGKDRKTAASEGEWLVTKKRKVSGKQLGKHSVSKKKLKAPKKATAKTTRAKKSKPRAQAGKASQDVIEILSEESDSKPSPLAARDNNQDDPLWHESDDEEYEFVG